MDEPELSPTRRWLPSRRTTKTAIIPMAAFCVALVAVLSIWYLVDADETRQLTADTQRIADQMAARLESTISTRLTVGALIKHELRTGGIVNEEEFTRFTAPIHDLFPDFQAINWVNGDGIITWVTPLEGNEAAVNLDLNKLALPSRTLAKARESWKTHITPPIELAQGGRGFVAYVPLETIFETQGFLNIVFRVDPLIIPILTFNSDHRFHVSIRDGDHVLFGHEHEPGTLSLYVEKEFPVGNRTWNLSLSLSDEDVSEQYAVMDEVLMAAGVILAWAIALLIRTAGLRRLERDDSEQAFRDFAETASDWFWEMDKDLKFTRFSGHILNVFGEGAKYYIGKTRREISADRISDPYWQDHLADLDAHRAIENFAYNIDVPGKDPLYISISGRPIYDHNGEFAGYRGTGSDITKQRDAERALVLAKEEAENANSAKSEFLAHMSHELRSPLNSIIGFSQIWADQMYGPIGNSKYLEYAKDINNASTHLLAIISDILDISKIEAGEVELETDEIDTLPIIHTCLTMLETVAESGHVKLRFDAPSDVPNVIADERALKQILINIITNAIKFTPKGGLVTIQCSSPGNQRVAIIVSDTGIGIGKRDISKVLEPFGQVRASAMVSHEGTGLGLPLARRLAELQNGSLSLESDEGQGTTVRIELPAVDNPDVPYEGPVGA
jgi:PAS domain S-box-containing protein